MSNSRAKGLKYAISRDVSFCVQQICKLINIRVKASRYHSAKWLDNQWAGHSKSRSSTPSTEKKFVSTGKCWDFIWSQLKFQVSSYLGGRGT